MRSRNQREGRYDVRLKKRVHVNEREPDRMGYMEALERAQGLPGRHAVVYDSADIIQDPRDAQYIVVPANEINIEQDNVVAVFEDGKRVRRPLIIVPDDDNSGTAMAWCGHTADGWHQEPRHETLY